VGAGVDDHFYSLRRGIALSDARRKHKDGAGLSQDVRKARGLELTPEEEKLLARQVNMLCVCTQMMVIVYVCVKLLIAAVHSLHREIARRKRKEGAGLKRNISGTQFYKVC